MFEKKIHIENPCRLTVSPEKHWSRYPSVILSQEGNYCMSWYRYPPPESAIPCSIYFCKGSDRLDSIATRTPIQVIDDGRNHSGATLCQDGFGQYHLAWHCWPQRKGGRYLLSARSSDGVAWPTPVQLLPQITEYMIYPSLTCHPSGRFWLTFSAGVGPGSSFYLSSHVYLTSSKEGKLWETPVWLPTAREGDNKSTLAVDPTGRNLVVVWRYLMGETYGLRWSSTVDGCRWREPESIEVACRDVDRPKLSSDNSGRIWLSYEGDNLIWVCWFDSARGWSQPILLNTGASTESRPSALIQNQKGEYWMAWTSQRDGTEIWAGQVHFE